MEIGNRKSEIRSRGLTLIELLVSVAILAIMILAFSTILTQCRTVVSTSQAAMRANSAAAAIAQVIRSDLRRVTRHGFLAITQANGQPALLATVAGVTHSVTGNAKGMGSVVVYGLCPNGASGANGNILFRQGWVLDQNTSPQCLDQWSYDLAWLQVLPRSDPSGPDINERIDNLITFAPGSLNVPAGIGDINTLWQVLAARCSELSIEWTDGTLSGANLEWYNEDNPKNPWIGKSSATGIPEFDAGGNYRALWTHHDQNNWPTAIKVRFSITDPAMPEVFEAVDYEVICPIGQ